MNNTKLFLGLAATVSLSACVTGLDTVKMTSQPSEALVVFEDSAQELQPQTCNTPCEIKLSEYRTYKTTVSKSGYEDYTVIIEPQVSTSLETVMVPGTAGGAIIGAQVSTQRVTTESLSPNDLDIILVPTEGSSDGKDADG
ncbi:PEGA domain-containing protein [Litorimonas sp. WD9-15]|uniref:PEGA domain-containing protein n=1 Tax=Litorimonas sp. WD9-15 TaxID=3418716 RepID=UPI003D0079AA